MRRQCAALMVGVLLVSGTAFAAGTTQVLSAFEESDPFDGWLYPVWEWELRKAKIGREYLQGDRILRADVLNARRSTHRLSVNARIGLYRDLELFLVFPFVLRDQTELTFAGSASSLDPLGTQPDLFSMPNTGPARSGFGDMAVGLRYSPFQQWRDPYYPSWVVAFTWTIPTGKVRRGGNAGVGNGWHELKFETGASRRIAFVEPYFDFHGTLRIPSSSTLFKDYGPTQGSVWPGQELGLRYGVEFVPWEVTRTDGKRERYATIDLGGSAVYTFRGRGYTDLFEAFASSKCNGAGLCPDPTKENGALGVTQYNRTLQNWTPGSSPAFLDGITDVEAYGTYSVWAGFDVQPIEYLSIGFRFTYSHETAHFLNRAIVGKDLDGHDGVMYNPERPNATPPVPAGVNEYNPVYNSSVDDPGRRFKSEGADIFGIGLMLIGKM